MATGLFYYFYWRKPTPVPHTSTPIKEDARNVLNASSKLASDLKTEGKNVIKSGEKIA